MIIDAHVHLGQDKPAVKALLKAADQCGIDRLVVFAGDINYERNEWVLQSAKAHPDRLIPFAWFLLGFHEVSMIDEVADQGFKGVKFIYPREAYNDLRYWPVYERCAARRLVGLFHTGIVARDENDRLRDVDTERMKPIKLDRVMRRFTDWNVIIAHLGNPWHDEAAMMLRWHTTLYSDLSGSTLKYRSPEFLRSLLWWGEDKTYRDALGRVAFDKIVFGTDVAPGTMPEVCDDYRRFFDAIDLSADLRAKVMGGTVAGLLGIA
jgi:predicted TIM-barrel fold metal-dependent hydrolase